MTLPEIPLGIILRYFGHVPEGFLYLKETPTINEIKYPKLFAFLKEYYPAFEGDLKSLLPFEDDEYIIKYK